MTVYLHFTLSKAAKIIVTYMSCMYIYIYIYIYDLKHIENTTFGRYNEYERKQFEESSTE